MSAQGRGRRPGFVMGQEHRVKIANSKILNRLISHAEGDEEMSQSQVTAGLALLKKIMPDLSSQTIEHTGADGEAIEVRDVTPLDIARRIAFALANAERPKD